MASAPGISRPGIDTATQQQQEQQQQQQRTAKQLGSQPSMETTRLPRSLSIVRALMMVGFAAIPVLTVKREINTGLLILAVIFGVASIVSWSIVSWPKLSSQVSHE